MTREKVEELKVELIELKNERIALREEMQGIPFGSESYRYMSDELKMINERISDIKGMIFGYKVSKFSPKTIMDNFSSDKMHRIGGR